MEEHLLACVENLDSDLVCARGFHLDIFELEWLACTPAYGSLALDDFSFSFRHESSGGGATRPLALRFSPITRPIIQISKSRKPGRLRTLFLNLNTCPSKTSTTSV